MLKIKLISVGKIKEKFLEDAVAEFRKRLTTYCKLEEVVIKEETQDDVSACTKESAKIIDELKGVDYVIALAINGKQFSSVEFSEKLESLMTSGVSSIAFIIGSSHGLSDDAYNKCDLQLSFSKMTFPHQMFKYMFLEQLYRAFKISKNENYHK